MKIVGVIPVRLCSVRFPGKALADLEGRKVLSFVCEAVRGCSLLDEFFVATDSVEIADFCRLEMFPVIMTHLQHESPTSRIQEISEHVPADLYVMVGGDEPLVTSDDISCVVKKAMEYSKYGNCPDSDHSDYDYKDRNSFTVINAVTDIWDEDELYDASNIKVVLNENNEYIYASRNAIPGRGKSGDGSFVTFPYKKFAGIGVYSKNALDFFVSAGKSALEQAEECDLLRFIGHKIPVPAVNIGSHTLSVDTPEDLEKIKNIFRLRHSRNRTGYKAVIFDLDGTLLNTEEGIFSSVRHTISVMGYPPLSDERMRSFIGPPVKLSLMNAYHLEEAEAVKATGVFRDHYKNVDLFKAVPYDGIFRLLKSLRQSGYLIGVATLKRDDYAHHILEHFQMDRFCDSICGSDFESRMRKKDVLELCLGELGVSAGEAVLIGDTASDGNGAKEAGVDFMAVTFGFGFKTAKEWSNFSPVFTADSPEDIERFYKL